MQHASLRAIMAANNNTIFHDVTHCRQKYAWDCGIACVMMVLGGAEREHLQRHLAQVCVEEGFGHNTWTIDLCYLLHRYGVTSQLYTTTTGVNEAHRTKQFYEKHFHKDRERVLHRFACAASVGIMCLERRVSSGQLLQWLSVGPLILLADARMLTCLLCKHNKLNAQFRWLSGSYSGHYVVCVGVSRDRVYYMDPARAHVCVTTMADLECARTWRGTDQDIIRII